LSGALGTKGASYKSSFKFAGGLEPGAAVRYAGGPKAGRVEQLRVDPKDPARIEVTFSMTSDTPVKTDSIVKISSLSALGENYLEVTAGSPQAARAPDGYTLPSKEYTSLSDIADMLGGLGPEAQKLIEELNARAAELKETIVRVNDLINAENRANVSKSLGEVRGMLEENRPKVRGTLTNVESASKKIEPLIDDFKKTVADAQKALGDIDSVLLENREDVRVAVQELKKTLTSASALTDQLDRTMNYNAESIDEMLENIRHTTENLKQFTDTIRTRPSSLIRSSGPPDRKPGGPPPKKN
jgi:phospholipid/cholesterol/gamma-HCH transport system substrate-binding protein